MPEPVIDPPISSLQLETANAILNWIIENDLPVGYHLKELQLCDIFKLSRSPIRRALALLELYGVVTQQTSRGYFLVIAGRDLAQSEPILPVSSADELYRIISTAWFNNELDEVMSTAELRRRFGSHEQDVVRVLERLADDGVIVRQSGKGWRLGSNLASEQSFHESYEFRMVIEPGAILLRSFRLDQPLAALSRRRHEEMLDDRGDASIKSMVDADLEFHRLIAISCRNQFFEQAILRSNALRRLTEILTMPGSDRLHASSREHMTILNALEAEKFEVAAVLMRDHLTVSRDYSPDFLRNVIQVDRR